MKALTVSDAGKPDIREIGVFTLRKWGADQKQRYLATVRDGFERLCRSPTLGRLRADISPGLRSIAVGRHVIFYRDVHDSIRIVRILHESMDMRRRLGTGPDELRTSEMNGDP